MRGDAHVRFGGRVEKTDRWKHRNGVSARPYKQEWTREGWLYLAAVLDAASKRIVGWSMSDAPTTDLVVNAVSMAAATRRPDGPVVHHTDRGSVYTSLRFGATLTRLNLVGS
ncbi:MAG: DDE-type integrase/transposase/recombinase, partial [Thioalkalivibrio sp.]|nr:DDE-type integrase/transposase/recombinase [Thioalkalivibrio sp.]